MGLRHNLPLAPVAERDEELIWALTVILAPPLEGRWSARVTVAG